MKYLIIYDIPREMKSFQVKLNRTLKKIGSKKFQHSVWESGDLHSLQDIARMIKKEGGIAVILKKTVVG